ncbi:bifunctional glutamate N-acetyltransferase/amino-acid acetyltransferase ArgJ [Neptuniibacter sp. 2_MG-2023]|uniref:bifunctional glutamate N-acetyltransferase/amino-acid acetyltransferase ArgJ n=1 Tax=Neptuniibacter sp. 2_MG-2023 TaxID=3062671 RepID=UPI0026E150F2|nr:bifunctional glutamate N-acetyltransferase/amino-acid acetyltransferase ArgJ [Neptuniibacter sp. 2_MG-2023]MDO6512836.1 bifunctional glutamate N-acetyltransferase/amino-acid acetyltransferase ArgJ [Neptuniibacter sp. 2_MG-2023]
MAVGPATFPSTMHSVKGFELGTASAGIKTPGRKDVVLMHICEDASVVGVFTKNAFCAAPVSICKEHLSKAAARYLIVNTGNANAGTGQEGWQDAVATCSAVAELCDVDVAAVLPFSTGVIGEKLPVEKLISALPKAKAVLSESGWLDAAEGILTTDTRLKGASLQYTYQGQTVTLTGISKGSGMIKPNMATMLGYVATDADVEPELLQKLLIEATDCSFNRITVDGDTSTNDSCMLVATGKSSVVVSESDQEGLLAFRRALACVMQELAHAIIRDGEGATKFVTVKVESAATQDEALRTAFDIAHSPLVKTALFASDPNWGRILAVVGRAGIDNLDLNALQIFLGDVCIVSEGGRDAGYTEEAGQAVMDAEEILIRVVLNRGDVTETVWTTDLSHDYVSINADYRS